MVTEHAEFIVHAGKGQDFEAALAATRHLLTQAQGCRQVGVVRVIDRPDTYLLLVDWEHLEDHTEVFPHTAAGRELVEVLTPLCAEPPRVFHTQMLPLPATIKA